MNTQEIFDKVVNHMRAQGNPWGGAGYGRAWCYVNPKNPCERCAKGVLMEVEYNTTFNEYRTKYRTLENNYKGTVGRTLTNKELEMLNSLEGIFEFESILNWEDNFKIIAARNGVNYLEKELSEEMEEKQSA